MVMTKDAIEEACLLGTVAGMRSMMPMAVLSLSAHHRRWLAVPAGLAAGWELIYDKLPKVQDRTKGASAAARLVSGAVAGGIGARLLGGSIAVGAGVGALAALASTYLCHRLRSKAAGRVPPVAAAMGEDLLAIGVSARALKALR